MTRRTKNSRTIVPGIIEDMVEYDGDNLNEVGENPRLSTITVLTDREGKRPHATVFGELTVGERRDDVSLQFQYNNSTVDVMETSSGTGATGNADSMASVSSGTGVGSAAIESKDALRYRPGHEAVHMATFLFEGNETGVDQKGGIFNGDDGFAVGYQGTTFGMWFLEGGNETFIPQSDWNEDKLDGTGDSDHVLNPAKLNIYKISFGWLGIAPVFLSVYAGHRKGWVLAHVIDLSNVDTKPHLQNPSLPIQVKIDRVSGTGTDLTIRTGSWRAGVVGESREDNSSNRPTSHTVLGVTQLALPTRTHLFSVTNKATFQGKTNHVTVELVVATFVNDTNKSVAFFGTKGATLAGNTAFVDKDTENSVLEVSEGGTVTGGAQGPATVLLKTSDRRADVRGTRIIIHPGETFTLESQPATTGSATGVISASFRFEERF